MTFDHDERVLLGRIALAFALCFALGFEREVRGAPAGDRTYAMVGTASAAVTAVAFTQAPQAIAGVLTGIGFIGGGLVFRSGEGVVKGITSAATLFTVVAIGIVAGSGHGALAVGIAVLVLVDLELRNIPLLRRLDARRYVGMVRDDEEMPELPHHDA
ncbi:MAG: MgtC/SapB family protein [Acidimicrobiales bacterium]